MICDFNLFFKTYQNKLEKTNNDNKTNDNIDKKNKTNNKLNYNNMIQVFELFVYILSGFLVIRSSIDFYDFSQYGDRTISIILLSN